MNNDLWQYLKSADKPVVLYGMGNGADKIIKVLNDRNITFSGVFASDGFVRDKHFHGMKIESYKTLKEKYGQMIVLLCFGTDRADVIENIKKIASEQELYAPDVPVTGDNLFDLDFYKVNKAQFEEVYSRLADEKSRQTFNCIINYKLSGKIDYLFECEVSADEPYESFLFKTEGERFLDLGAYNGDTVADFIKRYPDYGKITAVEPDIKNFRKLTKNTESSRNIECKNLCISDVTKKGSFKMLGGRNSAVGKGAGIDFSTVDDLLSGDTVTLIKMDIEGEELKAIKSAEKTISMQKPKMIISCYHRSEDLFTLPKAVFKYNSGYKLYMRHMKSLPGWDTAYYFL